MQKRHFKYTVKFTILFEVPYRIFYFASHALNLFRKYIKTPESTAYAVSFQVFPFFFY